MAMSKARTDLMQGTLELLILKTLARESMHGYEHLLIDDHDILSFGDGAQVG
jgi:DNA-binding PadR family transcriptional regulator